MIKTITSLFVAMILFAACAQNDQVEVSSNKHIQTKKEVTFKLNDFFKENESLDDSVQSIFNQLSTHDKVAQLIMPAIGEHGQSEKTIDKLVKEGKIGGILLLNGTKSQFTEWVSKYNSWNDSLKRLPFFYSADAEPS